MTKTALLAATALACLTSPAAAESAAEEAERMRTVEELVVTGEIKFRDRVEGPAPVLSYDTEYFQRFEPLTAGDAMKRVPSVAFLSDVRSSAPTTTACSSPARTAASRSWSVST